MPKLSPTMTKGKVTSLFLKDLQAVSCHDIVFEVATETLLNTSNEKLIMDIEVIEDMYVAKVFEKAGETLKVGRPIAILCDDLKDVPAAQNVKVQFLQTIQLLFSSSFFLHNILMINCSRSRQISVYMMK